MSQLSLKNIIKTFGNVEVVKDVSLDIQEGEFVVFVGPSGCGKSTLLRMIAGLEHTSGGDILIDGKRVNDLAPVNRGIAMVFQSYALYPHMSVYENIAFPLRVERASKAEIDKKVKAAAAILHLESHLQQKPGNLSGGQRQRVAIGRAIVREPGIFLFDEPLSNLDAALRADMRIELTGLHKQLGVTMIYVTHDQVEAMTMADRIVVINAGYIAQVGAPLELYHKPQNTFVAGFIGNPRMNFIPVTCLSCPDTGEDTGVEVDFMGQRLVLPVRMPAARQKTAVGATLSLGIRPEHITLGKGDVPMTVTPITVEHLGQQTLGYATGFTATGCTTDLSVEAGTGEEEPGAGQGKLCFVLPGTQSIKDGEEIQIAFSTSDCYLFDADGQAFERNTDLRGMTQKP